MSRAKLTKTLHRLFFAKSPTDMRFRAVLGLAAVLLCFVFCFAFAPQLSSATDNTVVKLSLALMAGWLVFRAGYYFPNRTLSAPLFLLLTVCVGIFIRACALNVETLDYQDFLAPWTARFREEGMAAFAKEFSNYNMPYLYMLAIIARFPLDDLYLIKLSSVVFDCALVLAALRLGKHFQFSPFRTALLGAATFLAPTVWLNSAYWGQCDVIYAFFILMAFIYILEKRPSLSFAMAAFAFSFKLQAIFFLPCYLVFWIGKRVRLKHFLVFPAVYLLSVFPAWLMGKPWKEIFGVYFEQAGTRNDILNFNSPSMYAIVPIPEDFTYNRFFFFAGIILAAVLIVLLCYLAWERRDGLHDRALLVLALCMVLGIPWFLPCMHERYFFLADVFFILTAFLFPARWYFAPIGIFCSYAGYHAYITRYYIPHIGVVFPAFLLMLMLGRAVMLFWQTSGEKAVNTPGKIKRKAQNN